MTPPFKGEAQGTFRRSRPLGKFSLTRLPLNPEKARRLVETYTPERLLGGVQVMKLAYRKLFYVEIITLFKITYLPTDF